MQAWLSLSWTYNWITRLKDDKKSDVITLTSSKGLFWWFCGHCKNTAFFENAANIFSHVVKAVQSSGAVNLCNAAFPVSLSTISMFASHNYNAPYL